MERPFKAMSTLVAPVLDRVMVPESVPTTVGLYCTYKVPPVVPKVAVVPKLVLSAETK